MRAFFFLARPRCGPFAFLETICALAASAAALRPHLSLGSNSAGAPPGWPRSTSSPVPCWPHHYPQVPNLGDMTKIARAILIDELLRFAEEKGMRESGSNPIDSVRTMTVKARSRYITDSELRRIKVAMLRSSGQRADQINPAGQMTCAIVDMAYLTGQRIGDVLALQWTSVGRDGILFQPAKTEGSTGAQVLIEWTPRLRALIDRVKGGETPPHARYPPPAEPSARRTTPSAR